MFEELGKKIDQTITYPLIDLLQKVTGRGRQRHLKRTPLPSELLPHTPAPDAATAIRDAQERLLLDIEELDRRIPKQTIYSARSNYEHN